MFGGMSAAPVGGRRRPAASRRSTDPIQRAPPTVDDGEHGIIPGESCRARYHGHRRPGFDSPGGGVPKARPRGAARAEGAEMKSIPQERCRARYRGLNMAPRTRVRFPAPVLPMARSRGAAPRRRRGNEMNSRRKVQSPLSRAQTEWRRRESKTSWDERCARWRGEEARFDTTGCRVACRVVQLCARMLVELGRNRLPPGHPPMSCETSSNRPWQRRWRWPPRRSDGNSSRRLLPS